MAAERLAEAAIGAARPVLVGLRQDRVRRRERVKAEFSGGGIEIRRRPGRAAAAAADTRACAAPRTRCRRRSSCPGDCRPCRKRRARIRRDRSRARDRRSDSGQSMTRGILRDGRGAIALDRRRAHAEIVLVEAPRHRAVMHGAAAGLVAVVLRRDRRARRVGVRPPRDRHALGIGPQILALEIAQLVVRLEVRGLQARAALEPDHLHAGLAELGGENPARGADADDDDIGLFRCHG